jgi:hypothetical protein
MWVVRLSWPPFRVLFDETDEVELVVDSVVKAFVGCPEFRAKVLRKGDVVHVISGRLTVLAGKSECFKWQ